MSSPEPEENKEDTITSVEKEEHGEEQHPPSPALTPVATELPADMIIEHELVTGLPVAAWIALGAAATVADTFVNTINEDEAAAAETSNVMSEAVASPQAPEIPSDNRNKTPEPYEAPLSPPTAPKRRKNDLSPEMKGRIEAEGGLKRKDSWADEEESSGAKRGFWSRFD